MYIPSFITYKDRVAIISAIFMKNTCKGVVVSQIHLSVSTEVVEVLRT